MEAFLASLPIVTSALGGALEMVDESCGRLVRLDDLDSLTEALRELLDNPHLRKALGRSGYNRVHQLCDPETQIGKLKDILVSLTNGPLGPH
jgi:glycosyltransferase involved in cell wall biosynthesis